METSHRLTMQYVCHELSHDESMFLGSDRVSINATGNSVALIFNDATESPVCWTCSSAYDKGGKKIFPFGFSDFSPVLLLLNFKRAFSNIPQQLGEVVGIRLRTLWTVIFGGQTEVQQQLMQMNLQLHQQQLQLELLQRQMQQQQIMARVWQSPWAPAPRSGGSQSLQLEGLIGATNNETNAPDTIQSNYSSRYCRM